MKVKTTITKREEIEVVVNPVEIINTLYSAFRSTLASKDYSYNYFYITMDEGKVIRTDVREGISHGHYEQEDTLHKTDITDAISQDALAIMMSYELVLDNVKNNV